MCRHSLSVAVLAALLCSCGGEPPDKELHEAQGAIDAARAAGAEAYARAELDAAQTVLQQAQQSVADRDFRLALSQALEARQDAQQAARKAADEHARARSEAERALADLTITVAQIEARLKPLRAVRTAARTVAAAEATLEDISRVVQEARTALAAQDYLAARSSLQSQLARLTGLAAELEASSTQRRRR